MEKEITFAEVKTPIEAALVADLANTIWREHYIPIIGEAQVNYMLTHFQSAEAIQNQLLNGVCYYSIHKGTRAVGYLAFEKKDQTLFLSKIYLLDSYRGRGIGKRAMSFIEAKAYTLGCAEIALTVNKYNDQSITAYSKMGFVNRGSNVTDIGGGFTMDDYLMVNSLRNGASGANGNYPV